MDRSPGVAATIHFRRFIVDAVYPGSGSDLPDAYGYFSEYRHTGRKRRMAVQRDVGTGHFRANRLHH